MSEYRDFVAAVDRLKRNETQMSPEQIRQYEQQLKTLRRQVCVLSYKVALEYMITGLKILAKDSDAMADKISQIVREECASGVLVDAAKTLLATYSTEEFFKILYPSQMRVWYEGYGPYWASHCKPVEDSDSQTSLSYYNDIIDMFWSPEWNIWKRKDKWQVTIMMPPTMELINAEHKREILGFREGETNETL